LFFNTIGSLATFAAIAHRKSWVAALSVRFREIAQFRLRAQRRYAIRPSCRLAMSALGWELPLDGFGANGRSGPFASIYTAGGKRTFAAGAKHGEDNGESGRITSG